jgi:steroid delta-isomerase
MDPQHPALVAARNSWRCAQAKDKAGWLALMADDICVEDPIGVAPPTNPDGEGIRGKDALARFFDQNIAATDVHIEAEQSYAAGSESAHVLALTTSFPNGVVMKVRGIFTYVVNDAGLLTNLRGHWSLEDAEIHRP